MGLLDDWLMDQADPNKQYRANHGERGGLLNAGMAALYNNNMLPDSVYNADQRRYTADGSDDAAKTLGMGAYQNQQTAPQMMDTELDEYGRKKKKGGMMDIIKTMFSGG